MPLTPGTKLGAYEIQSAVGAGGMGEVYKARDPKSEVLLFEANATMVVNPPEPHQRWSY